ncbi:hypothetical protein [Pseudomonas sp. CDFA 610]|uniref:hypothetical protein n=1 Tax=Pseudomonas sp. CDFA 610 TaxID=2829825 RepID=UPI001E363D61|nr:hypothetical protein [Pseudomonas sp. CDFA 610]MCD5986214.1 hypothetical protein [Pseudomonas sp. CDFA 610]
MKALLERILCLSLHVGQMVAINGPAAQQPYGEPNGFAALLAQLVQGRRFANIGKQYREGVALLGGHQIDSAWHVAEALASSQIRGGCHGLYSR